MMRETSAWVRSPADRRWIRGFVGGAVGMLVSLAVSLPLLFAVGPSTVFNEALQSPKLTAVWGDELGPPPLMMSDPATFALIVLVLGAVQGLVFVIIHPALPRTVVGRGLTYGVIVWLLSTLYFELLGPFNLLLEPLPLVGVELAVGLVGGLAGGIVLSAIYGKVEPDSR